MAVGKLKVPEAKEPLFVLIHRQKRLRLPEKLLGIRNQNWLFMVETVEFVTKILMDTIPIHPKGNR